MSTDQPNPATHNISVWWFCNRHGVEHHYDIFARDVDEAIDIAFDKHGAVPEGTVS